MAEDLIKTARFIKSSPALKNCPPPDKPEFAFIGRSNVGKSSLINMICNNNRLAQTSAKPGKTRLINHFVINDEWNLVDLPGYGFASVSKTSRKDFEQMINTFITKRNSLICTFVLIDSRIPLQPIDLNFMSNLAESGLPFVILFTKCDKLSKSALDKNIEAINKGILENFDELPLQIRTSAEKKIGREEVLGFIKENKKFFKKETLPQ
jgi:GTP-binding protein